jgi:hypothetical protein
MLALMVAACGPEGPDPDISAVKRRAAFEMQCNRAELKAFWIDDKTIGVKGCSQRLVYVQVCHGGLDDCQWILNSESRRQRDE